MKLMCWLSIQWIISGLAKLNLFISIVHMHAVSFYLGRLSLEILIVILQVPCIRSIWDILPFDDGHKLEMDTMWFCVTGDVWKYTLKTGAKWTPWSTPYEQHVLTLNIFINSFPPNAAYMRQWTGSALVQVMAWHRTGDTPLPKPMLIYCQFDPCKQLSVNIESKF